MKSPLILVVLILLAGLVLLGLSDTYIAIADTNVYDIETYIELPEAGNSSSSCIAITMTGIPDE